MPTINIEVLNKRFFDIAERDDAIRQTSLEAARKIIANARLANLYTHPPVSRNAEGEDVATEECEAVALEISEIIAMKLQHEAERKLRDEIERGEHLSQWPFDGKSHPPVPNSPHFKKAVDQNGETWCFFWSAETEFDSDIAFTVKAGLRAEDRSIVSAVARTAWNDADWRDLRADLCHEIAMECKFDCCRAHEISIKSFNHALAAWKRSKDLDARWKQWGLKQD